MAISIICTNKDPRPFVNALKAVDDSLDIRIWPDDGDKSEITMALCWQHPTGALNAYPNLACICSLGAGVDHLLADPDLPVSVPVVRIVDDTLATQMFDYVYTAIMYFVHHFDRFNTQQRQHQWLPHQAKAIEQVKIGIMGLGQLGGHVAKRLVDLDFSVSGWSRSNKFIVDVKCFSGDEELQSFLARSHILVNLLPLTEQTQDRLNAELFAQLPQGAYVINVGRGRHLVDEDLIAFLDNHHLAGACLDVFRMEPLPASHPFWSHPAITVTPHCSSLTSPEAVASQIVDNYYRAKQGKPLLNPVDVKLGY